MNTTTATTIPTSAAVSTQHL
ncbi:unnamed protein product, partial [Rotaria sp. Silwood2]